MAGNANSGKSIAFKMPEKMLADKMDQFRKEYGDGQHGMVSWPQFCDFIGYSIDEVAECYQRGKEGDNAYSGRARLLEVFETAVDGMTMRTCNRQQALAKAETERDYLRPKVDGLNAGTKVELYIRTSDDRVFEIAK